MHYLGKTLLAFAVLLLYSKAELACYSRYILTFLTSYFCIPVPYDEKDIFFFLMLALEGLLDLLELVKFNFDTSGWRIDLDYCNIEWFALETNRDHSVILRLHPRTAFQTLVDCEGTPSLLRDCCPQE